MEKQITLIDFKVHCSKCGSFIYNRPISKDVWKPEERTAENLGVAKCMCRKCLEDYQSVD
jgi:hypothetical protein